VVRTVFAERRASREPDDDPSGKVRVSARRVYLDRWRRWGLRRRRRSARNGHARKRIDQSEARFVRQYVTGTALATITPA
jgi:hypothetical protein